ncbi:MAG: HD domain-containing protein [Verrucomicrobia bacterium]|nr:HD domain-containing protein [Verrucomicrobiota bacterium]
MTLREFSKLTLPAKGFVRAQLIARREQTARNGKPFLRVELADETERLGLNLFSGSGAYDYFQSADVGECLELTGVFGPSDYGPNVEGPSARALKPAEVEAFFAGGEERRAQIEGHWEFCLQQAREMQDPRLRWICVRALEKFPEKWRRAAAARKNHHARRGGLLDHTAQMLKVAKVLAPLYPEVDGDLLAAGVIFHDLGKLWENDTGERGFGSVASRRGELIGHISLGIEVANALWREGEAAEGKVVVGVEAGFRGVAGSSSPSDRIPPRHEGVWVAGGAEDARGFSSPPYRQHGCEDGDVAAELCEGEGGGTRSFGGASPAGGASAVADQRKGVGSGNLMRDVCNLTSDV